jgi:DNA-binding beta-propeller fold protein YncE
LNQGDGTVTRIDPATNRVAATIGVGVPGNGGDINGLGVGRQSTVARLERICAREQRVSLRSERIERIATGKNESAPSVPVPSARSG